MADAPFTRREALALVGAAFRAPLLPGTARAATIDRLALHGPPAGPSVTLAHAVATEKFAGIRAR